VNCQQQKPHHERVDCDSGRIIANALKPVPASDLEPQGVNLGKGPVEGRTGFASITAGVPERPDKSVRQQTLVNLSPTRRNLGIRPVEGRLI
jgi:hypothetical protein